MRFFIHVVCLTKRGYFSKYIHKFGMLSKPLYEGIFFDLCVVCLTRRGWRVLQ